jgi:hypothetical protein
MRPPTIAGQKTIKMVSTGEARKLGEPLHSVWKKSYLEITCQYGWVTVGNQRAYWSMLA